MAAIVDRAREGWEQLAPRERNLLMALAATFAVMGFVLLGRTANSHMDDIEAANAEARRALAALQQQRINGATGRKNDKVEIPSNAVALDSYLEKIVKDAGLESPKYPAPKSDEQNGVVVQSFKVAFESVSLEQIGTLLERIENDSAVVVVREISVDRNFKDKEKLDLEIVVASYSKPGSNDGDGSSAEEDG